MHCITAHKQRDLAAFFPTRPLVSREHFHLLRLFVVVAIDCLTLEPGIWTNMPRNSPSICVFNLLVRLYLQVVFVRTYAFFPLAFCYWFWTKKRSCFVYFSNSWINIFIFCCFFNGFAFSFKVILRFIVFRCASNLNYIFWAYRTNIEWKKWAFCRLVFPSLYLMTQLYCHIEVCT